MKQITIPTVYALKKTMIIESDKTLNRQAGRKTEIFLAIETKQNVSPLSMT